MAYALAGHTWDFIYTVFAAIDILVIGALLAARRSTFRRQAVWFIIMLINPVVMFGAYIMVGKPVFRRRFRVYRNEGIDLIDRAIMDRTSMAEPLSAARALARSGALGFSADSSAAYIPRRDPVLRFTLRRPQAGAEPHRHRVLCHPQGPHRKGVPGYPGGTRPRRCEGLHLLRRLRLRRRGHAVREPPEEIGMQDIVLP
ncbi:hypothetical protein AUQ37_06785 [Candidatus Methanomethylophilus sp. 1R26]|uniref:hypothetical protein n=1 Tax=Candidatus Methanomethylophilus sp. 1R26 TaxID=1769296 RepID=UPI000737A8D9|nr:hypothetical protein [Candidatus Methanomethylophilus sp. 1R26]KUE73995.1 hypothetical protein AUQ37_06785 [Candidatus Methanomethylophilus sp. 1R26]